MLTRRPCCYATPAEGVAVDVVVPEGARPGHYSEHAAEWVLPLILGVPAATVAQLIANEIQRGIDAWREQGRSRTPTLAGDLECDHVPGRWYDGVHCHRITSEADLRDISLVSFPDDPRTYRMEVACTPREIRAARGRPLHRGEVPLCTHCTEGCDGADRGPREEDVDQSLWAAPALGGEGGA